MTTSIARFVVDKLNQPDVSVTAVSKATGIPVRTIQHLKAGNADNAWASRVEQLALHFGYRLTPVPVKTRKH